ncbi:hypothetical protein P3S67_024976 [Capsicum chacoense]
MEVLLKKGLKKMRELEEIFLKLNPQAEEFASPPLSNDHGVVPISPSGEQFRFDAFNFVMQNGLADGNFNRNVSIFSYFSFSSYWKIVYLQMIGSQFHVDAFKFITQNGLADENFNRKVSIFSCFSFSSNWKIVYLQMLGSQFHIDAFKFVMQNKLADGNFNRKLKGR